MKSSPIVCVVDDDELVRQSLCDQLERSGFATVGAADGASGLEAVLQACAAVAVIDIVMPDHEGLEMVRLVKQKSPHTRILAISGATKSEDYLKVASAFGADEVLQKPFAEDAFIVCVKRLVSH